eukprot:12547505-Heterocapsa_arctica.AAC.1
MVDISSGEFAHYFAPSNAFARIDRVLTSSPPWMLANICVEASVCGDLQKLFKDGVSDRAPVR